MYEYDLNNLSDSKDRAKKNAVMGTVVEINRVLLEPNPGLIFSVNFVKHMQTKKVVDAASKQVKFIALNT